MNDQWRSANRRFAVDRAIQIYTNSLNSTLKARDAFTADAVVESARKIEEYLNG